MITALGLLELITFGPLVIPLCNNIKDVFTDLHKFHGEHFKVGGRPGIGGHGIKATNIPKEDPEFSKKKNRYR